MSEHILPDPRLLITPHTRIDLPLTPAQRRLVRSAQSSAHGSAVKWARPNRLTTYALSWLFHLSGWHCIYCFAPFRPEIKRYGAIGPDHVIALSDGGPNLIGNLVPCCFGCNQRKDQTALYPALQRLGVSVEEFERRWNAIRRPLALPPVDVLAMIKHPDRTALATLVSQPPDARNLALWDA